MPSSYYLNGLKTDFGFELKTFLFEAFNFLLQSDVQGLGLLLNEDGGKWKKIENRISKACNAPPPDFT